MTFSVTSCPLINADVLSLRRLADVALLRVAPGGLELCASGTFAQDLSLETVANNMVRRHAHAESSLRASAVSGTSRPRSTCARSLLISHPAVSQVRSAR
jgi:hypothetical protein